MLWEIELSEYGVIVPSGLNEPSIHPSCFVLSEWN